MPYLKYLENMFNVQERGKYKFIMYINEIQHVHRDFAVWISGLFIFINIFYKLNVAVNYILFKRSYLFFYINIITIVIIIYRFQMVFHINFLL